MTDKNLHLCHFQKRYSAQVQVLEGLYVPKELPTLDEEFLERHLSSHYKTLALDFLEQFGIDIETEVLIEALKRYDAFDDPSNPVPLSQIEEDCFVSELYHGPTRAFKDMALQPFGYVLSKLAQKRGEAVSYHGSNEWRYGSCNTGNI